MIVVIVVEEEVVVAVGSKSAEKHFTFFLAGEMNSVCVCLATITGREEGGVVSPQQHGG